MKHERVSRNVIASLLITSLLLGCSRQTADRNQRFGSDRDSPPSGSTVDAASAGTFYTVSHYNESSEPSIDLRTTIDRAKEEHKRIILQVGGDWCVWCTRISHFMRSNDQVRGLLEQNFVVMKVTYPGDHASEFLQAYPKCEAFPHFLVLDQEGAFLHSQGTSELERDASYDEKAFVGFLTKWMSE